MQKIKVGRRKPRGHEAKNPHRPFLGIVDTDGVQPPQERKEGWLGNPPWLKDKEQKGTND